MGPLRYDTMPERVQGSMILSSQAEIAGRVGATVHASLIKAKQPSHGEPEALSQNFNQFVHIAFLSFTGMSGWSCTSRSSPLLELDTKYFVKSTPIVLSSFI